jgi:hypothetical protein
MTFKILAATGLGGFNTSGIVMTGYDISIYGEIIRMKKGFLISVVTGLLLWASAGISVAAPVTLIDQGAMWNYTVLTNDLYPAWGSAGYNSFNWNTATWQQGQAAFGNPYSLPYHTYWAAGTDLALQSTFNINGALSTPITLDVASDNGFMVFINGTMVAKQMAEGYTAYWEYVLPLSTIGFVEGLNVIQVLAEDHGGATFFDMKLTADVTAAPVPEPATMFLFGSGIVGLLGSRFRKNKK